uniref:Uncharacterized protein n=1 Tax=Strigamia maritima TaxID=126957 RepID=T1INR1_STRMM
MSSVMRNSKKAATEIRPEVKTKYSVELWEEDCVTFSIYNFAIYQILHQVHSHRNKFFAPAPFNLMLSQAAFVWGLIPVEAGVPDIALQFAQIPGSRYCAVLCGCGTSRGRWDIVDESSFYSNSDFDGEFRHSRGGFVAMCAIYNENEATTKDGASDEKQDFKTNLFGRIKNDIYGAWRREDGNHRACAVSDPDTVQRSRVDKAIEAVLESRAKLEPTLDDARL